MRPANPLLPGLVSPRDWRWLLIFLIVALAAQTWALDFPGLAPGVAKAEVSDSEFELHNDVIACRWSSADGKLRPVQVVDHASGRILDLHGLEAFGFTLADGQSVSASSLKVLRQAEPTLLAAAPGASILAERFAGRQITVRLAMENPKLEIEWRAILRDHANALRQEIVFRSPESAVTLREVRTLELPGKEARVAGTVPGSPLTIGNFFLAYEHPEAQARAATWATCVLTAHLTVRPELPVTQSCVIGVAPEGQMRRAFLYYLERERAHPYQPFLHYNAWYDICWGERKITERECLDVIDAFGSELIQKRGVPLAAFVWDDGWDDPKTLWRPIATNFPNGFQAILQAARRQHSTLGFWLSPFGGYGKPKDDRIAMGKAQGFETGAAGFSLAGPNYYTRFLETCAAFIEESGANFFKFDGLARSVEETEAMLRLTRSLRTRKPDLFISITTGTWPSPFWLWYGDSTWRGGGDMGFFGAGPKREQWITYRDMETFRNVVQAAPLYPLNSLMTQGFAQARYGTASEVGRDDGAIRRELRSFFASGTCLQELYVSPDMMTARNWDDLAECAQWAHRNADVLVDTHWVGSDPGKGAVYGWASWTPRQGILAVRNPSAEPNAITLDLKSTFELPPNASRIYTLRSPWKDEASQPPLELQSGTAHTFQLAPFQVLVLDALPN